MAVSEASNQAWLRFHRSRITGDTATGEMLSLTGVSSCTVSCTPLLWARSASSSGVGRVQVVSYAVAFVGLMTLVCATLFSPQAPAPAHAPRQALGDGEEPAFVGVAASGDANRNFVLTQQEPAPWCCLPDSCSCPAGFPEVHGVLMAQGGASAGSGSTGWVGGVKVALPSPGRRVPPP